MMTDELMQANEAQKTIIIRFLCLLDHPAFSDEFTQAVIDGLKVETAIVSFITEWEARTR